MIPLRSTERVYAPAVVTGVLIAINTVVFLYEETLSQAGMERLVMTWGIVPDRLQLASLFTSMFLHAGWLHLIGNMLYLWVFGRNIEDLIGPAKFLAFYILCGLASAVVHVIFNAYSPLADHWRKRRDRGSDGRVPDQIPARRIITLVLFFFFFTTLDIPAALLLLWWFAMQFFSGFGSHRIGRLYRRRNGLVRAHRRISRGDAADQDVPAETALAGVV